MKSNNSSDDSESDLLGFRNIGYVRNEVVPHSWSFRPAAHEILRKLIFIRFPQTSPLLALLASVFWIKCASANIVIDVGSGADGDLVIQTNLAYWGPATFAPSSRLSTIESTQLAVVDTDGFQVGDEVMLYTYQAGTNSLTLPGQYEFGHITGINGVNFLNLDHEPVLPYDLTNARVTVLRVPNFRNLTVSSNCTLSASAWNGNLGGIMAFRVQGKLTIDGSLTAAGAGFAGGPAAGGHGINGFSWSLDSLGSGGSGGPNWWTVGQGGLLDPDLSFQRLLLGSGGGGGGQSSVGSGSSGGPGGGLIYAVANEVIMTGIIDLSGGQGGGGSFGSGGGGGGSGGELWLQCWNALGMVSTSVFCSGILSGYNAWRSGGL